MLSSINLRCGSRSECFTTSKVRGAASVRKAAVNDTCASPSSSDRASAVSRRDALLMTASALGIANLMASNTASAATQAAVGNYLPASGVDDLVTFTPNAQKTPALRAGVIKTATPYKFAMSPSFTESKISNTISGNFCMPNCGEPWTEVIFESTQEGKVQLLAANLVKLTNKKSATMEDLGTPEALLQRIGPNITGTYLDDDDLVASSSKKLEDGRTYYFWELNAPGATNGPHSLTSSTIKDEVLYIFIASASDKQWARSQTKLREIQDSFRA